MRLRIRNPSRERTFGENRINKMKKWSKWGGGEENDEEETKRQEEATL